MRRPSLIYDFATPPSERKMTGREGEKGPCVVVNLQRKKGARKSKKWPGFFSEEERTRVSFKSKKGRGSI
jgi:hypothetical protein